MPVSTNPSLKSPLPSLPAFLVIIIITIILFSSLTSGAQQSSSIINKPTSECARMKGLKAVITAPQGVCIETPVDFKGSTARPIPGISWQWQLGVANTSALQNPPTQLYSNAGQVTIRLIAGAAGCYDTAVHTLEIYPKPALTIANRNPVSCSGRGILLNAGGVVSYKWTPAAGLSDTGIASPLANPETDSWYGLEGISAEGCRANDSVFVRVARPFQINLSPQQAEICQGQWVNLIGSGAQRYEWIGNTFGVRNMQGPNQQVAPPTSVNYTLVGYDFEGCFTDTARAAITVHPLPQVDAGPNVVAESGKEVILQASTSGNIVEYNWWPAIYLNCANCPTTISKPRGDVNYTLEVKSDKGCTASAKVSVSLIATF